MALLSDQETQRQPESTYVNVSGVLIMDSKAFRKRCARVDHLRSPPALKSCGDFFFVVETNIYSNRIFKFEIL